MNADGTADGKDMKSGDIGEFVPSTSGKKLKRVRLDLRDMSPREL